MYATLHPATSTIPAFVTTVGSDHTVRVPSNVPSGTRVAIVIVDNAEHERTGRFDAVLATIRAVVAHGHTGEHAPAQDEIAMLVKKARVACRASATT